LSITLNKGNDIMKKNMKNGTNGNNLNDDKQMSKLIKAIKELDDLMAELNTLLNDDKKREGKR
jgi:hypothetical protein